MGFEGYPITTTTPITYDLVEKLWQGWLRRKFAMGVIIWPPPDNAFPGSTDSGTVAAVSDNGESLTITCNRNSSWGTSINGGCGPKRWVGYTCTECFASNIPSSYDVIIVVDLYDCRKHIRFAIVDQVDPTTETGTGQLIVDPLQLRNAVTAGYLSGVGDLGGKEYYIIKRGGAWMSDRWPERPDDQQQWRGYGSGGLGYWPPDDTTDEYGVVTHNGPQYVTLADSDIKTNWETDVWVGLQVMVYNGSVLKRLSVVHNDARTLYLNKNADATGVGGQYSIVDVGRICNPTRALWYYGAWYSGMGGVSVGHTPDDTLATVAVAKTDAFRYTSGDKCVGAGCNPDQPVYATVFDNDYQIDPLDSCAGSLAGNYINRNVWKSFRMLMVDMEANCGSFIPQTTTVEGAEVINNYTPATWFRDMGNESGTASTQFFVTSSEEGTEGGEPVTYEYGYYYFTVDSAFIGKPIRWTVLDDKGKTYANGSTTPGDDGKVTAFTLPYSGKDIKLIGVQVIYSVPWTRIIPRLVRYLYGKTIFIPSVGSTTIGGEITVIDPPQAVTNEDGGYDCSLRGKWITRGPSTIGGVDDPYIPGELYRYIGDDYRDPFPGGSTEGIGALLNPYWDKFYRGHLSKVNQSARDASRSFKVTRGDYFSVSQTKWNWAADWVGSGTLRLQTLTITAGSATTLTDNTKDVNDNLKPDSCWFKNDGEPRYLTDNDAYVGFILRIDRMRTLPDPDPLVLAANPQATVQQTVTFKVPIQAISYTGSGGVTLTFNAFQIAKYNASNQTWGWENFIVQTSDVAYIVEPRYELSKWAGRKVRFVKPDGTVMDELEIKHSDNDTLYFDTQSQPFEADTTAEIIEMPMGVYRYLGDGEWEPAEGSDSSRLSVGSPNDFKDNINWNNEGWYKGYGLPEYHDMMHPVWINQIWKGQDLLRWTKGPLGWTNKASATAEPEKNAREARAGLPYWTESPEFYAWYVQYVADYNAANDPDININNVVYNTHEAAWKRCWQAIFDINDPYHSISEAEYEDILAGGDGTKPLDGTPPQQTGMFEDCYAYLSQYDGFYLYCGGEPNCNFANYWDEAVLSAYIYMKAVESYGIVSPQLGFKRLNAEIVGVVHSVIGPGDPEEGYFFPYGDGTGTDFCSIGSRMGSTKNKFEEAGSGAVWRKYHVYSSWAAAKGTTTAVYGPKYGSKNFVGDPSPTKLPCLDLTCTYTDYAGTVITYKPCQGHDDYGQLGWYVNEQFTIIKWDMEGF